MPFIKYVTGFLAGVFAMLTLLALMPEAQITIALVMATFGTIFAMLTYALVVIERKVMAAEARPKLEQARLDAIADVTKKLDETIAKLDPELLAKESARKSAIDIATNAVTFDRIPQAKRSLQYS